MAKQYFELLKLDNSQEHTAKALGLTDERIEFLEKELLYEFKSRKRDKISASIAHLVTKCDSIEEVAWITYLFGKEMGRLDVPKCLIAGIEEILERRNKDPEE